jgi:hypothetical protein
MFRSWKDAMIRSARGSDRQRAKAECRRWPAAAQAEAERQFHEDWDRDYQLQLELEWACHDEVDEFDMLD